MPPTSSRKRFRFLSSIYTKLAVGVFLSIVLVGLLEFFSFSKAFNDLVEQVDQQLQWDMAAHLANRIQPLVIHGINPDELEMRLFDLTITNPAISIYVLNQGGEVLMGYPVAEGVTYSRIDLGPIKRALQLDPPNLPLHGQDPANLALKRIFSVAPLQIGAEKGLLYVLVSNGLKETLIRQNGQFVWATTLTQGFLFTLLGGSIVGALAYTYLTRRFHNLSEVVRDFAREDFSKRARIGTEDEVGELARTINVMADSLVAANARVQEQDQSRRDFIASIAHDLRTPLTAIIGHLDLASTEEVSAGSTSLQHHLAVARDSAVLQNSLVSDLFELSKLEAQEQTVELDALEIDDLLRSVGNRFSAQARTLGVSLEIIAEVEQGTKAVLADPRLIVRALGNLVDNALTHTPAGGSVALGWIEQEGRICISVRDTGVGISPEHESRVFEKFYQVQPGKRGAGLGLSIVKRILQLHGTALTLQTAAGVGTTFSFSLEQALD